MKGEGTLRARLARLDARVFPLQASPLERHPSLAPQLVGTTVGDQVPSAPPEGPLLRVDQRAASSFERAPVGRLIVLLLMTFVVIGLVIGFGTDNFSSVALIVTLEALYYTFVLIRLGRRRSRRRAEQDSTQL